MDLRIKGERKSQNIFKHLQCATDRQQPEHVLKYQLTNASSKALGNCWIESVPGNGSKRSGMLDDSLRLLFQQIFRAKVCAD